KNPDLATHLADGRERLHEWTKTGRKAEDGAISGSATVFGHTVQAAVGSLEQTSIDAVSTPAIVAIEFIQGGQRAIRRDHEDGAVPLSAADCGGSIEVAVGGLHERRIGPGAIGAAGEGVHRCELPAGGDLEDGSGALAAAELGRSPQVAI